MGNRGHIVDVFGHKDARWFKKVKWRGCEKLEWEREHLLVRDGYTEAIRDFWARANRAKVTKTAKRDAIFAKKEGAAEEAAESEMNRRRKGWRRRNTKKQLTLQVLGVNI